MSRLLPNEITIWRGGNHHPAIPDIFRVGYQGFDTKSRARADRDLDLFRKRELFVRIHGIKMGFNVITYTTKHMPSYAD